jgi:hypothetical protein
MGSVAMMHRNSLVSPIMTLRASCCMLFAISGFPATVRHNPLAASLAALPLQGRYLGEEVM